ncbi:unnamed protein product, partial [Candidula unifasciata]
MKVKKPKTKSGAHKASLAKLANKRTNRLAKQGKLHKVDKKKKKRRLLQESANKKQVLQLQQQKQLEDISNYPVNDEEEDDANLSDHDVQYFKKLNNAHSFLRADLNNDGKPRSKKRKRTDEDEEESYEQLPRQFQTDQKSQQMKMMLPIIAKGKVIKKMVEAEATDDKEEAQVNAEVSAEEKPEEENKMSASEWTPHGDVVDIEKEKAYLATLSAVEVFAYRENKLLEKKQKIATLSHAVLEDPQNSMKKLKELRLMLGETALGVSLSVRKYAMISLMEVFKDIVPGYRLRIPTEKEKSQRVKKETKSLWDYEASFLLNYKIYLEFLETMAKVKPVLEKTFLTKHGITDLNLPRTSMVEFGKLALKCLCEMLVNHPHFNYRSVIISAVVPFMNHKNSEFSEIACDAVKRVFKADKTGDIILEIVRDIGRMAKKRKFDVRRE